MLRILAACGLLCLATAARAQASASVSVVSDDRYRGVSLSDGDPALQAGVGVDAGWGGYAGAFVSSARLYGRDMARWNAYGGWAGRFRAGAGWDVGVQYTGLSRASHDGYPELYAGLGGERLGVRVAYAWRYFGGDDDVIYTSLDAQQPLTRRLRLLAHVGWLHPMHDADTSPTYDARLALGVQIGHLDVQLARTFLHADASPYRYASYPVGRDAVGDAWVVGVTRRW